MDARARRLKRLGVAEAAAEKLVAQGLGTPRKIKAAKVADLRKAKADKDAKIKKWREKK